LVKVFCGTLEQDEDDVGDNEGSEEDSKGEEEPSKFIKITKELSQ